MIIDLSVSLNEKTPTYPGDPPFLANQTGNQDSTGCVDHEFRMGNHLGTHIDAPAHVITGGAGIDDFGIEKFAGRGRIIDVSDNNFSQENFAEVSAGEIIILHTGMSAKVDQELYFHEYPVMPSNITKLLVDKKIAMVAVDACSVDPYGTFINHETLLSGNVLIAENLCNTEKLLGKNFKVYALPLKLRLDGSPARIVAEISS
ncbi:cyclase family protein [Candidatus Saccharibacteria bacterium]|jgi:arylformamidase|nr:cyclase family protein [Candidatus Saccharibacteria bacterium]